MENLVVIASIPMLITYYTVTYWIAMKVDQERALTDMFTKLTASLQPDRRLKSMYDCNSEY